MGLARPFCCGHIVPRSSRASCRCHHYSIWWYPPCLVILSDNIFFCNSASYIHRTSTITASIHDTHLRQRRIFFVPSLSPIDSISHNNHRYTQFCTLHYPSLEESSPVLLWDHLPPVLDEYSLLPLTPLHFFDYVYRLYDMDYLSNLVDFLPCFSVLPPLDKYTRTPSAWLNHTTDSTEDSNFYYYCVFASEVPYITKYISSRAYMDINSPNFDDITLIQTYICPLYLILVQVCISLCKNGFCGTYFFSL